MMDNQIRQKDSGMLDRKRQKIDFDFGIQKPKKKIIFWYKYRERKNTIQNYVTKYQKPILYDHNLESKR